MEDSLKINTSELSSTSSRILKSCQGMMNTVVSTSSKTSSMTDSEKILIGNFSMKKIEEIIKTGGTFNLSLENTIKKQLSSSCAQLARLQRNSPLQLGNLLTTISKNYKMVNFQSINLTDLRKTINSSLLKDKKQYISDDTFSSKLFTSSSNGSILSINKLFNLKTLYSNILSPITKYYKQANNISSGTSILNISQCLSKNDALQNSGNAVIFNILGVNSSKILKDVSNGNITNLLINKFGILSLTKSGGIYASNPITVQGSKITGLVNGNTSDMSKYLSGIKTTPTATVSSQSVKIEDLFSY